MERTVYTPLHAAAFRGNIDAAARAARAWRERHGARHEVPRHARWLGQLCAGTRSFAISFCVDQSTSSTRSRSISSVACETSLIAARGCSTSPKVAACSGSLVPDEWTKAWWTPLAFAVVSGKSAAARALLELGADTRVRDPESRTLREIAVMQGKSDIVALSRCLCACAAATRRGSGDTRRALLSRTRVPIITSAAVRRTSSSLHTAGRILRNNPDIARDSIYTAVVCGDLEYVQRAIAARPEIAREKGGPKGSYGAAGMTYVVDATGAAFPKWEPLLYLCFTRLENPASNDNALAIAKLLLDNGADPNSYFMAGGSRYSPLTGVIGEGEEERPPHPRRNELTRLLLERGANPYDMQVFYNIHFRRRRSLAARAHLRARGDNRPQGGLGRPIVGHDRHGRLRPWRAVFPHDRDRSRRPRSSPSGVFHTAPIRTRCCPRRRSSAESRSARSRCTRWRCGAGRRRWPTFSFASERNRAASFRQTRICSSPRACGSIAPKRSDSPRVTLSSFVRPRRCSRRRGATTSRPYDC